MALIACLEVLVISGKSLSSCGCGLIHSLLFFLPLPSLPVFLCDSHWSVNVVFSLKGGITSFCPEKFLFFPPPSCLPAPCPFPSMHFQSIYSVKKWWGCWWASSNDSTLSPSDGRPLRRSAKLDFNEAIAFIISYRYEASSQESERQTDGWVYQHIGVPLGGALK